MLDHNLDLLFITETWLTTNDSPIIAALNTPPYLFTHLIRDSNNFGGGIGILHRSTLNVSAVLDLHHSHSESLTCSISPPRSHTFNIALFYRPPSISITSFIDEFRSFALQISPNTIVLGDFNIPLINTFSSFTEVISHCNLTQHIDFPTHESGNTLDLLISPKICSLISSHHIGPPITSP